MAVVHRRVIGSLLFIPSIASAQLLVKEPAERCTAVTQPPESGAAWLDRAASRVLPQTLAGHVLRYRLAQNRPMWGTADRMYGPFVPSMWSETRWFDPAIATEGGQPTERPIARGSYPQQLFSPTAVAIGRDTSVVLSGIGSDASTIHLNPWGVLLEWRAHAADVRVAARCIYRDYARVVLTRGGERLYLSESDATPVKLQRVEAHYFWGQVDAEYVWLSWSGVDGGGQFPLGAIRNFDGVPYESVGVIQSTLKLIPSDSSPPLAIPANAPMLPAVARLNTITVDTLRVSDHTFLLSSPRMNVVATLQRDTVFLLDVTLSEGGAQRDSAWIAELFPGRHAVAVVLTDLIWTHLTGLRYWVARGATIVAPRTSEAFLREVIDRRWTLSPDVLERARPTSKLRFRAVDDSLRLANGAVVVHALRGSSNEVGLGVWLPGDHFFWAGDHVQTAATSPYTRDVAMTFRAIGIHPEKVGGQRTGITAGAALEAQFQTTSPH